MSEGVPKPAGYRARSVLKPPRFGTLVLIQMLWSALCAEWWNTFLDQWLDIGALAYKQVHGVYPSSEDEEAIEGRVREAQAAFSRGDAWD